MKISVFLLATTTLMLFSQFLLGQSTQKQSSNNTNNSESKNNTFSKNGTIYTYVEQMPEFIQDGGNISSYLSKNIVYPEFAYDNNIEGRVFVKFIVNENGKVSDVTFLKHVHSSIEKEVLNIMKNMPNWQPGMQGYDANGKPNYVKVYFTLPITFKTDNKSGQIKLDTANAYFLGPRSIYYDAFPEFSGNLENALYLKTKETGIGTAKVLVTIDENGKLKNPRVLKCTFSEMKQLALSLIANISSPINTATKWLPATHNKNPESCDIILTVHFNDRLE